MQPSVYLFEAGSRQHLCQTIIRTVGKLFRMVRDQVVVVTLSFNAKMDLANFECNLKTRDSEKWPSKGDLSLWECGNVEGADLKQDNQSTAHIDP